VERGGKAHKNLALNAAPIDVAEFLRRRLFESDTSIIMTSATLATSAGSGARREARGNHPRHKPTPLAYFTKRVGAESATMLQVGTPFDYERQMKLFRRQQNARPARSRLRRCARTLDCPFREADPRQGVVLFTNYSSMQELGERMEPFFNKLGVACFVQGKGTPRSTMLEKIQV